MAIEVPAFGRVNGVTGDSGAAVDHREPVSRAAGKDRHFAAPRIHSHVVPARRQSRCEDLASLQIEAGDRGGLRSIHAAGDEEALAQGLAACRRAARKSREHERQDLAAINRHRGC